VKGPAQVTSTKDTAKALAPAENNVKIINVLDPATLGSYLGTQDGEKMVMNIVRRNGGMG
jgi:hypothetical protein